MGQVYYFSFINAKDGLMKISKSVIFFVLTLTTSIVVFLIGWHHAESKEPSEQWFALSVLLFITAWFFRSKMWREKLDG
jgi:uncharacterized membrane protein YiaA